MEFEALADEILHYIRSGGIVMWPLVAGTFVLWYALGYRLYMLRRGNNKSVRQLVSMYRCGSTRQPRGIIDTAVIRGIEIARRHTRNLRKFLNEDFTQFTSHMATCGTLARIIVLVAPLAGLLGTVNGMIEMFDSLGDQTFYSQSGGIARGISEALFTTQLGLAIAVPGMIVSRILEKRQNKLEKELEQVKNILCMEKGA
mgnify:CR=1 FL=1